MNTLTFFAPSGSPASGVIIDQLSPPGNTSGKNYVGFFGAGGPQGIPFAVIVGRYQDRTFITNMSGHNLGVAPFGVRGSGELFNHKFVNSTTVNLTQAGNTALSGVPIQSGTILVVFQASGAVAVVTQNALLRTVALNAVSGINDVNTIVTGIDVRCYEVRADSTWTNTAGAAAFDNRLFLDDHNTTALRHDWYIGLSASPEAVGQRRDWGFFFIVEFL